MCAICLVASIAVSVSPVETENERLEREQFMQTVLAEHEKAELEMMELLKK